MTRQWISVPRVEPAAALALAGQSWRVLDAVKHVHKLRTGDLVGNRFRIVVREVAATGAAAVGERLDQIARRGLPNRFGRQRFGREGDNATAGRRDPARRWRGPATDGAAIGGSSRFLVSALQSSLFNQVLERRPAPPWQLVDGDLAMVHRSGGLFLVGDAAAESARAAALEISPTGPIFGAKMRQPAGAVRELEESVWREQGLPTWDDLELPRGLHVDGTRRALRVPIGAASLRVLSEEDAIELRFELPAGSYATVLIEELFAGRGDRRRCADRSVAAVADESGEQPHRRREHEHVHFHRCSRCWRRASRPSLRVRPPPRPWSKLGSRPTSRSSSTSTPTSTPCSSVSRRRRRRRSASPAWSRCAPRDAPPRPRRPSA